MKPVLPSQPESASIPNTRGVLDAACEGKEISAAEALHLLQLDKQDDLHRLCEAADIVRQRQVGDAVTYGTGSSLFLTNHDEVFPTIYDYSRKPGDNGTWTVTIDEIDACLERLNNRGWQHLSVSGGGFWSYLQIPGLECATLLKTYTRLLGYIRERCPRAQIQGFSPDEIEFLRIVSDRSERYILELFKDQGLQVLGGNGAEILVDTVRQKISPKKAKVKRWFEIAATAHALEIPMIYKLEAGHYETLAQRVQHLEKARTFLKKHPGAFTKLVPQMRTLKSAQNDTQTPGDGTAMAAGENARSPQDRFKLLAVSRLFLGEWLPVQQVFQQADGTTESQEALQWGANHFGDTDSLLYPAFLAGSRHADELTEAELAGLIRETGREAVPVK